MTKDRREQIRALIREQGEITLRTLEALFPDVSTMTLRRDLIRLEQEGLVRRTRGGAVSIAGLHILSEDAYSQRIKQRVGAKRTIAQRALDLVEEGRSLYLDSGTTMMAFARAMLDRRLTVITSGPGVAMELVGKREIEVILTGGRLSHNTLSVSGPESVAFIESVNIDIAFMSASGYAPGAGFTAGNREECQLKREVISRARTCVMLMDSSKVGRVLPFTFAVMSDIDVFVSDDLPAPVRKQAAENSVLILTDEKE